MVGWARIRGRVGHTVQQPLPALQARAWMALLYSPQSWFAIAICLSLQLLAAAGLSLRPADMLSIARTGSWAVRIGCAVHLIHHNLYEVTETYGESMLPTLNYAGDFVHADKTCRGGKRCRLGDVIIATKPTDSTQRVCKRIVGMPGDIVCVDPTSSTEEFVQVPEGHVWLAGDNLTQSLDSRSYGPLPMALIKGKVVAVNSMHDFAWIKNGMK